MRDHFEVAVLGSGPAGSVTACRLAALGYEVVMFARARQPAVREGISERATEGLRVGGCVRALACLGPEVTRLASWNGVTSSANRERIVDRPSFDEALAEDAAAAGVTVVAARVRRFARTPLGWTIDIHTAGDDARRVRATFLIEARGRQAPRGRGERVRGPATSALTQSWRLVDRAGAQTALAAFADGWAWFAASGGRGVLQIMITSERGALPGRKRLADHYRTMLASIAEAREWVAGARPAGPVTARNAAPTLTRPVAGDGLVRVGDAGVAIDPLSGHGMFEAVGSALAAASVVNTLVARPRDGELAMRFFRERAERGFERYCRVGRDFYAQERRWAERPFWAQRRRWPDAEPAHGRPVIGLARLERRPVVAGDFVSEAEVYVTPDHPRGVWRIAGVPLAELKRYLDSRTTSAACNPTAAAAVRFGASLDAVDAAIGWLAARGLIPTSRGSA